MEAPAATDVSIDGDPFASGSFDAAVPLSEDEGFDWVVREGDQTTSYHGRCLPSDFPPFSVERPGQPQAQWYLVAPTARLGQASTQNYAIIFDNHGVPVWWYKDADFRPFDARLLPNDHLVWAPVLGVYREHAFDSTAVLHTWQTSGRYRTSTTCRCSPTGTCSSSGTRSAAESTSASSSPAARVRP